MSFDEFQKAKKEMYRELEKTSRIKFHHHTKAWKDQLKDIPDHEEMKRTWEKSLKTYTPYLARIKVKEAIKKENIDKIEEWSNKIKAELESGECPDKAREALIEADKQCDDAIAVIYMKQALE